MSLAQTFYDMHIIEYNGSGVRRMRRECDKNGSPYPTWTSEKGEFCIRFLARTSESAAKFGLGLDKCRISATCTGAHFIRDKDPQGLFAAIKPGDAMLLPDEAGENAPRFVELRDLHVKINHAVRDEAYVRRFVLTVKREIGYDD